MRRLARRSTPLVIALLALPLGACFFSAPGLVPLEAEAQRALPGLRAYPDMELKLGRLSLGLARSIVRAAAEDDEEEQVASLLQHVNGVELAVYDLASRDDGDAARAIGRLSQLAARRGWLAAARFQDAESSGAVFFQQDGGGIRGIYIVALEDDSLTLVRLRGRLDRAIADAIALAGPEVPRQLVGEGASRPRQEEEPRPAAPEAAGPRR